MLSIDKQEDINACFNEFKHISFYEKIYKELNLSIIEPYETIIDSNPYTNIIFDSQYLKGRKNILNEPKHDTRFLLLRLYVETALKDI